MSDVDPHTFKLSRTPTVPLLIVCPQNGTITRNLLPSTSNSVADPVYIWTVGVSREFPFLLFFPTVSKQPRA